MQQLWVVWAAMLFTQPVIAVVAYLGVPPAAQPADPTVILPLLVVAGAQGALSLAWGRIVGARTEPAASIVRWAFAESIALFGLVLRAVGAPELLPPALMFTAFLLLIAQPPRAR